MCCEQDAQSDWQQEEEGCHDMMWSDMIKTKCETNRTKDKILWFRRDKTQTSYTGMKYAIWDSFSLITDIYIEQLLNWTRNPCTSLLSTHHYCPRNKQTIMKLCVCIGNAHRDFRTNSEMRHGMLVDDWCSHWHACESTTDVHTLKCMWVNSNITGRKGCATFFSVIIRLQGNNEEVKSSKRATLPVNLTIKRPTQTLAILLGLHSCPEGKHTQLSNIIIIIKCQDSWLESVKKKNGRDIRVTKWEATDYDAETALNSESRD